MLHLNEHGWGLGTLMGFIFVFLLAILLISVNAYKMGLSSGNVSNLPISRPGDNSDQNNNSSSNNSNSSGTNYLELESKLGSAAVMYKDTYYSNLIDGDSVYVTNKQLFSIGFLNEEKFNNGECVGYVKIRNNGGNFEYIPYLSCGSKYQTSGFMPDLAY